MAQAKLAGYQVALHFVYVSSLERSKQRVSFRVKAGGHDVPEVDQERRYEKSLQNLKLLLPLTDEAYVYRNDFDIGHEIMAKYVGETCSWCADDSPDWMPK